jgi:hypothetical protein
MNGRISQRTPAQRSVASACAIDRSLSAAIVALGAGATAVLTPPLAVLALCALAARVLLSRARIEIKPVELLGPSFAALLVYAFAGLPGAIGVVFVWRVIADTRWSVAEAARLAAAAGRPAETQLKALAHAWATPLYGVAMVAFTSPHTIAGLPLDLPHLPLWSVIGAGVLALAAVSDWGLRRAADWRLGELAGAPAAHLLIHHALFALAFGLMLDVSAGVVMLAAWRLAHAAPERDAA